MKEKEILEKEREKIMKLLGLLTTIPHLHQQGLDRAHMKVTCPTGKTLIPRDMVTNIFVYAISTDIWMDSRRNHPATNNNNNFQHGAAGASEVISDMDDDLHMAASRGSIVGAREVVGRNQRSLRCRDSQGNLPLHLASKNGHTEMASYLVKEYPQASYALNSFKESPLYLAVEHHPKDLKLVESMFRELDGDAQVVDSLKSGNSIVCAAIKHHNQEMLKLILKFQRDLIKCTDEEGLTPLSYAAFNGFVDEVEYIIRKFPRSVSKYKNADKSEPVHKACLGGHIEVLQVFHSKAPKSLLSSDCDGRTVLHLAAKERGNMLKHVVSYLLSLQEGKELIKRKDENGCTPLVLAKRSKNHEVEQVINSVLR